MTEIKIADKKKYLEDNYPFGGVPQLYEKRECLHCGKIITVGDYKVYRDEDDGFEYICCPHAPECDGTIIDWMPLRDS